MSLRPPDDAPPPGTGTLVRSADAIAAARPVESDRYTVLLLNEEQLDRFLARPRVEGTTAVAVGRPRPWPRAPRLTVGRAAVSAAVLAAAATIWVLGTADDLETAVAAAPVADRRAPLLPTGVSFSVRVARYAGAAETRDAAVRLAKAGLPAFAWETDSRLPDLLVGPFVSVDEAERAQRVLAGRGLGRSRLHVDDRLQRTPAADPVTPVVLAVAAPGREALVFELSREPRATSGERIDATTFDVVASPTGEPIDAQEWKAPSDLHLIRHVTLEADPTGERGLTARVTLAREALARVRVERSRIYVDVQEVAAAPERPVSLPRLAVAAGPASGAAPRVSDPGNAPAARRASAASPAVEGSVEGSTPDDLRRYREAVAPVFARFEEIRPFMRAAVGQDSPEVLAALAGTFAELEQIIQGVPPPPVAGGAHGLLVSAVRLARDAASTGPAAERAGQLREAAAQFQAARAKLDVVSGPDSF